MPSTGTTTAYFIATLYAASGENEKALDLLERGYAQHDS